MVLTAYDIRENLYALILASLKNITPEQAFMEIEGSQEMTNKLKKAGYKICSKCGVAKSLDEFYLAKYKYLGETRFSIRHLCKECMKAKEREKYRKKWGKVQ